jgi:hypothetical protein
VQNPVLSTSTIALIEYRPVAISTVAVPMGPKVVGVKSTIGMNYLVQADGSEVSCDPQTADWWRENLGKDILPWD